MSERGNKKAQFESQQDQVKASTIIIGLLALGVIGIIVWTFLQSPRGTRYPLVKASNSQILIPELGLEDGKARFFSYKSGSTNVNFFIVKSQDGQLRAALDTCLVCYKEGRRGYRQEGDNMVCNKCNQKFHTNLINDVKGGCNPVPLHRSVLNGQITIPEAELIQGAFYFQNQI